MSVNFRGGQLDGVVNEEMGPPGTFYADWDPTEEHYVISNEDGDEIGVIGKTSTIDIHVEPVRPPLPRHKQPWVHSMVVATVGLGFYLVGMFIDVQTRVSVYGVAFVLMLMAWILKPGTWL